MSRVEIDIKSDHVLCGKTTIAAIIQSALQEYGIEVSVSQEDSDLGYKMVEGKVDPVEVERLLSHNPPEVVINDHNQQINYKDCEVQATQNYTLSRTDTIDHTYYLAA